MNTNVFSPVRVCACAASLQNTKRKCKRKTLTERRVCWAWVWLVREVWGSVPRSCYEQQRTGEARWDGAQVWASLSGAGFHCSESPSASSR